MSDPSALWKVTWLSTVDYRVHVLEVQAPNAELAKTFTMRTLWQTVGIPQDQLSFQKAERIE